MGAFKCHFYGMGRVIRTASANKKYSKIEYRQRENFWILFFSYWFWENCSIINFRYFLFDTATIGNSLLLSILLFTYIRLTCCRILINWNATWIKIFICFSVSFLISFFFLCSATFRYAPISTFGSIPCVLVIIIRNRQQQHNGNHNHLK